MKNKFENVHDLERIEKYYFFGDGILFSTQFALLYSLFNFMLQIENFFKGLEGDIEANDIELPEGDEDIVNLFKSHLEGDKTLENIYDECYELSEKIKKELGITSDGNISEKILTRDKKIFIEVKDLANIYHNFPIIFKTITSGVCDGMTSFPNQFKKTHKLVFRNKFEYMIYKNIVSPVNSLEIEHDVVLDVVYLKDLKKDIAKELEENEEGAMIYLACNDKDILKEYLDEFNPFLIALIPTNFGFLSKDDFESNYILDTNVW